MPISDTLNATSLAIAAPAVHCVIQWIRQWAAVSRDGIELVDDTMPLESLNIAKKIVAEIEKAEGVAAGDLPKESVQRYIETLSDLLEKLASEQLHTSDDRGREILKGLRSIGNR